VGKKKKTYIYICQNPSQSFTAKDEVADKPPAGPSKTSVGLPSSTPTPEALGDKACPPTNKFHMLYACASICMHVYIYIYEKGVSPYGILNMRCMPCPKWPPILHSCCHCQPVPELERYMDTMNAKIGLVGKLIKDLNDKIQPSTPESGKLHA